MSTTPSTTHLHSLRYKAGAVIRFANTTKCWQDGTLALDSVNLELASGECCIVIGPSGAGKTTLLRSINGLVTLTSGSVLFNGERVTRRSLRRIRSRIGMVHQQFNLVGRLPVMDNVMTGMLSKTGTLRSLLKLFPRADVQRACRLLAQVGLEESQLYRRAMYLSGGQQQRVAIARAFISRPDLVLADEPVASLDPTTSEDILHLVRSVSRQTGATVLCSLHQVELARQFADRIIGMRAGRLVFDGPPESLTDPVMREIYGTTAKNVAAAREHGRDNRTARVDEASVRPSHVAELT